MLSSIGSHVQWPVQLGPNGRCLEGSYWRSWVLTVGLLFCCAPAAMVAATPARGVPFTRSYSYEDIGNVPRGSRLGFDRFGRVAVIHDATYAVLNDSVWLNLAENEGQPRVPIANVVQGPVGQAYYGARASWGRLETNPDGRLHPVPLGSANPPDWIATAVFINLIVTSEGVFFASWNGVVCWDFKRQTNLFFEVPRMSRLFQVGERVYISAYDRPLQSIDLVSGTLEAAGGTELDHRG